MSKSRYYHVTDGEWVTVTKRGYKEQCCSCGHVHRVKVRVVDGQIQIQSTTDNRATAAARRAFKFEKEGEDGG